MSESESERPCTIRHIGRSIKFKIVCELRSRTKRIYDMIIQQKKRPRTQEDRKGPYKYIYVCTLRLTISQKRISWRRFRSPWRLWDASRCKLYRYQWTLVCLQCCRTICFHLSCATFCDAKLSNDSKYSNCCKSPHMCKASWNVFFPRVSLGWPCFKTDWRNSNVASLK